MTCVFWFTKPSRTANALDDKIKIQKCFNSWIYGQNLAEWVRSIHKLLLELYIDDTVFWKLGNMYEKYKMNA